MKAATVYKRADRIFLHASSKTTAGVWIATPPFVNVEAGASMADLGKLAMLALLGSQPQVPHPTKWSVLLAPLMEQAGVSNWQPLMRMAQCLDLEATDDRINVIPNRNLGAIGGFEQILDKAIQVSLSSSVVEIGSCITEAFLLCQ